MATACRKSRRSGNCLAHHRDTPPADEYVVGAGLLACGSSLLSGLPETKRFQWLYWTAARRLQLRGQRRHSTGFPLSSGSVRSGEPRRKSVIWTSSVPSTSWIIGTASFCGSAQVCMDSTSL